MASSTPWVLEMVKHTLQINKEHILNVDASSLLGCQVKSFKASVQKSDYLEIKDQVGPKGFSYLPDQPYPETANRMSGLVRV